MKKYFTRGVLASFIIATIFSVGFFTPVTKANAQTMTLCQTVDALVMAGVISPDKAEEARVAAGCVNPNSAICQLVDLLINIGAINPDKASAARAAAGCNNITQGPVITYLSVNSGKPGTAVTVYGSNFTSSAPYSVTFNNATHDNGVSGTSSPSGNSYNFIVPTPYPSGITPGNYTIMLENTLGQRSNSVGFVVLSATTTQTPITVLSPNGGENWINGTTQTIRWQEIRTFIATHYYKIYLDNLCGNDVCGTETLVSSILGPSYNWNISMPNGTYRVRVCDSGESGICDASNSNFTISSTTTQPSITVLSPNGGETYKEGDTVNIKWNSTGLPTTQKVDISLDIPHINSTVGKTIATGVANSRGTYSWVAKIPAPFYESEGNSTVTPNGQYKITVSWPFSCESYDSNGVCFTPPYPNFGRSNNYFTISSDDGQYYPRLELYTPKINSYYVEQNGVTSAVSGQLDTTWCARENSAIFAVGNGPFEFNWGDGSKNCSWFPTSHLYSADGRYRIEVRVKDTTGRISSRDNYVTIPSIPAQRVVAISNFRGDAVLSADRVNFYMDVKGLTNGEQAGINVVCENNVLSKTLTSTVANSVINSYYARPSRTAVCSFNIFGTDFESNTLKMSITGRDTLVPPIVPNVTPPVSTCTSFSYSTWGTCTNGVQTRTFSGSPTGCSGGTHEVLSQPCTVPSTSTQEQVTPTISVSAPISGDRYIFGNIIPIKWLSNGINLTGSLVDIYLQDVSGNNMQILSNKPNVGLTSWKSVTTSLSQETIPSGRYKVLVQEDNTGVQGLSGTMYLYDAPVVETPVPTATLSVNGGSEATVKAGESYSKTWSSTNGVSASSKFTSNDTAKCGAGVAEVNTLSGSSVRTTTASQAGCVWTLTYEVKSSTGQIATASVIVRVVDPTSTVSASNLNYSTALIGWNTFLKLLQALK